MSGTTQRVGLVLSALALAALITVANAASAAARPWLGVYTQEITSDLRDGMDLHGDAGVLINRVVTNGPAARAGLRQGDVIVRFNSRSVESPQDLARLVGDAREDDSVPVEVIRQRNGQTEHETVSVTLAERSNDDTPEAPPAPPAPRAPERLEDMGHRNDSGPGEAPDDSDHRDVKVKIYRNGGGDGPETYHFDGDLNQLPGHMREMMRDMPGMNGNGMRALRVMGTSRGRLGVRIESLNSDLAGALDAPGSGGVLVLQVMPDTPAEHAGLRSGDVILSVDGRDVKDAEALVGAVQGAEGKVSLTVSRRGSRRTIEVELAATPRVSHGDGPMIERGRRGEPDRGDRGRDSNGADRSDLRQQVDELREQVRELRQQLEERRHE